MKTKIFWLVVALMLVVGVLASCGGGGNTPGGNTPGNTPGGTPDDEPVGNPEITYDYDWQQTEILVKLTNSSNKNELSSGCKRYYAGQDSNLAIVAFNREMLCQNSLQTHLGPFVGLGEALKEFLVGLSLNLNQVGRVNDLLDFAETDSLLLGLGHGVVGVRLCT